MAKSGDDLKTIEKKINEKYYDMFFTLDWIRPVRRFRRDPPENRAPGPESLLRAGRFSRTPSATPSPRLGNPPTPRPP
jgi:hypothetical protein